MAGIYLHIPFCKQACTYCNFHFSTSLRLKEDLLDALHREIALQAGYLSGQTVKTVYFGGGTPSLLSADEINRLFDTLRKYHRLETEEITLEANPDDLSTAYLKSLRNTPVDRLSIGVQSFFERDLRYMNRAHSAQQADYAIKAAQDMGFTNLTIDLIYGTPGLTDQDWIANLNKLKELQLPHFSSYALTVEEGTALHHAILKKKQAPVDAEQSAGQFEILLEKSAEMGFEQYEISNFAQPGQYARHNTSYWKGIPYLGLGPSAHSFNGKARKWNIANNALYIKELLQNNTLPFEEEVLTPVQQLNEYIMTSLRTMWGCDLDYISAKWGADTATLISKESAEYQERNWLILQDKKLVLTPKGKLFADRIAGELFLDENP
jgi:oxygen-independent coproporphyrinogen-3 oxidase